MEPVFERNGTNGHLLPFRYRVVIRRKGISAILHHGKKGDKILLLKDITSFRFREASFFAVGEIEFSVPGSHDRGFTPAFGASEHEDHTIIIGKGENEQISRAKEQLDLLISDLARPIQAATPTSVADVWRTRSARHFWHN